ncbi:putative membrane protein YgcG [Cryobacterium mesophilum]|uniref:DUF2207 family protein n=1 Tax=Terrimesophilobacter mesophilus TaxID=433647 RepID=UPI001425B5BE|nr:DUF2207 domain-containing protein [Terrimesophilobacter mesophilus]MBB5632581.1 putative membrane protein YgcG [Terrimesophilobacter mesophilus]
MKRSSTALAILVFGFLFGAPLAASAAAVPSTVETGVQDFTFDSYSADYYLDRDAQNHSTLTTVETFVARFPDFDQNRGIIRAIPNDYDGVPLRTNVQSVVDENGEDVPFEKADSGGFTELALGTDDYVHGRTTYTITYTQQNVVRAFTDTNDDELYWDTNGTGFAQPFASVSARVHVASALKDFLTGNNACYQGPQGSTDACGMTQETQPDGDVVFSASARNLGPGETVTVAIGFTLGTFAQVPAEQQDPGTDPGHPFQLGQTETPWWVHAGSIVVAALAVLGSAFTIVWRFIVPAASKGSGIIIPQYTVPKDLNLLESADVVGRSWTGVPAQLVSFAVRGRIRILDYPVTASGAQYTLQLLNPTGVDDEELELLTAVFGGTTAGAVREVGVIDDTAARAVAGVSGGVRRRMLDRGFKKKRSSLAGLLIALGMFILIFVAVGFVILSGLFQWFSGWGILSIVLAFFAVFVCVGFAFRPAALTAEGAERRDYLLGMRDYLQLAEADRFRMLQSPEGAERVRVEGLDPSRPADKVKLYEKLLPFAVLWGIEREWAKELTLSYGDAAPDWFVSSGGFDAVMFSNALSTLSSTSVARSTPTASSGSSWSGSSGGSFSGGSFGGGFSGGGGGGGGGGGR